MSWDLTLSMPMWDARDVATVDPQLCLPCTEKTGNTIGSCFLFLSSPLPFKYLENYFFQLCLIAAFILRMSTD